MTNSEWKGNIESIDEFKLLTLFDMGVGGHDGLRKCF